MRKAAGAGFWLDCVCMNKPLVSCDPAIICGLPGFKPSLSLLLFLEPFSAWISHGKTGVIPSRKASIRLFPSTAHVNDSNLN